jgi:spore coat polysaccharide biosynthesis predicted glycosyltransferase SpsG
MIVSVKLIKSEQKNKKFDIVINDRYIIDFDYFNNYILSTMEENLEVQFEVKEIGDTQWMQIN